MRSFYIYKWGYQIKSSLNLLNCWIDFVSPPSFKPLCFNQFILGFSTKFGTEFIHGFFIVLETIHLTILFRFCSLGNLIDLGPVLGKAFMLIKIKIEKSTLWIFQIFRFVPNQLYYSWYLYKMVTCCEKKIKFVTSLDLIKCRNQLK